MELSVANKFPDDVMYHESVKELLSCPPVDLLHHNTAFTGSVNIARTLALYELYKKVRHLSGHIGEFGIWKGASFLLWAKLIKIFEPNSNTVVHGYDNFQGMLPTEDDGIVQAGSYKYDYEQLQRNIRIQRLDNIAYVHKVDSTELSTHLSDRIIAFKLVFMDCGLYNVVKQCLPIFWDRLVPGGIIIFDQFGYDDCPGESKAVMEFGKKVYSLSWTRSPSGYIIKE